MSVFRTLLFLIAATWIGCGPALAEKRVALVIGNSGYKNVPRLTNPVNDASLVADTFKNAGFDAVTTRSDLTVSEMRKTLREFGASTREADIAVIYYAGHGIELDGNNYLIPTDAALETDADVLDETLPLDRVLFAVEPAKRLRLIILDACRDNPFAKTMKRTIAARAVGRDLAKVEPTSPNTLIAFAAKAGSTASDGDDRGSPFTTALVKHIATPGLDLRRVFGYVRDDVLKSTNNRQEPYVYGSLGGDDVPLVPAKPNLAGPQPNPQDAIRRDYELALHLGTRDGWNAFLAQYPDGFYASLARGELNKVAAEETRVAAAEKARLAEQEKARLAAEGARRAEQEKAAAEAKAAEEARLAAEKAKQVAQGKAEAAERARIAAEKTLAERIAAGEAESARRATEKAATEKAAVELTAKQAVDAVQQKEEQPQKVAVLPPPSDATVPNPMMTDIAKSVQLELRRVGCLTAAADGDWNGASRHSMDLFNRYAGTKFDVKVASIDTLDAIRAKPSRVCPLVCDHGFKADGDHCIKVFCRVGYHLNDQNECEKTRKQSTEPQAKRDQKTDTRPQATVSATPQPSGQRFCGLVPGTTASYKCRPLKKGCRIGEVRHPYAQGVTISGEVCD